MDLVQVFIHCMCFIFDSGILTYANYLFLLTALVSKLLLKMLERFTDADFSFFSFCPHTETRRQFEVAFKMIDADKNDTVDSKEFNEVSFNMFV